MTSVGHLRGHPIYFDGKAWRYKDTDEPTAETWRARACGVCKKPNTEDDHDPCLGTIPGVMNACCGHGEGASAYIQFDDGLILRGAAAVRFIDGRRINAVDPTISIPLFEETNP